MGCRCGWISSHMGLWESRLLPTPEQASARLRGLSPELLPIALDAHRRLVFDLAQFYLAPPAATIGLPAAMAAARGRERERDVETAFVDLGLGEVLPDLPPELGLLLLRVFQRGKRQPGTMTWNKDDFIVFFALMTHPTFEEKAKIVFALASAISANQHLFFAQTTMTTSAPLQPSSTMTQALATGANRSNLGVGETGTAATGRRVEEPVSSRIGHLRKEDFLKLAEIIYAAASCYESDPAENLLSLELIEEVFMLARAEEDDDYDTDEISLTVEQFVGLATTKYMGASLFTWVSQVGQVLRASTPNLSTVRFDRSIAKLENTSEESGDKSNQVRIKRLLPRHEAALFAKYYRDPLTENLVEGESWYLISAKWFIIWSSYSGFEHDALREPYEEFIPRNLLTPGKITNTALLEKTASGLIRLKRDLQVFRDFWIVPYHCWRLLSEWHGCDYSMYRKVISVALQKRQPVQSTENEEEYINGTSPIPASSSPSPSPAQSQGEEEEELVIELYPLTFWVEYTPPAIESTTPVQQPVPQPNGFLWGILTASPSTTKKTPPTPIVRHVVISRKAKLRDLRKIAAQVVAIPAVSTGGGPMVAEYDHVLLYKSHPDPELRRQTDVLLIRTEEDLTRTVDEVDLADGDTLSLILRKVESSSEEESDTENRGKRTTSSLGVAPAQVSGGMVGLSNLGNTCFVNSSVQCLSHSRLLRSYFLSGAYAKDINVGALNGSRGKVAEEFGSLLRELWTSNSIIAPRNFKKALGDFDNQYSGFEQHDAQEMLARLLDCLSEDLNRIVKKPYIEQPDSAGRADAIVAGEWWDSYLRRERSIISALFAGQFKSSIHCSACGFDSARFEPFLSLSLPLPETRVRTLRTVFVPYKSGPNTACAVRVPIQATVKDVKNAVLKLGLSANLKTTNDLISAEISHEFLMISRLISDTENVSTIDVDDTIYLFEQRSQASSANNSAFQVGERVVVVSSSSSEGESEPVFVVVKVTSAHETNNNQTSNGNTKELGLSSMLNGAPGKNTIGGGDRYDLLRLTRPVSTEALVPASRMCHLADPYVTLCVLQQQWTPSRFFFLNPYHPALCGDPFCLRLNPDQTSGSDLYEYICEFLGLSKESMREKGEPLFDLRVVKFNMGSKLRGGGGFSCNKCHWTKGCHGCVLKCDETPLTLSAYISSSGVETFIMIDWGLAPPYDDDDDYVSFCTRRKVVEHSSVRECEKEDNEPTNLAECLKAFTLSEKMEGANECYCSQCKKFQPHVKQFSLWRAPPLLLVHLKRFHHTELGSRKLTRLVEFPLNGFDLTPFVAPSSTLIKAKYKLYAVVNHSGNLGGGHYTAIIRDDNDDDVWMHFDDGRVNRCPNANVVSKHAYMLFYVSEEFQGRDTINF